MTKELDKELTDAFFNMQEPMASPLPMPDKTQPILERDERARIAFQYLRHVGFTSEDFDRYSKEELRNIQKHPTR